MGKAVAEPRVPVPAIREMVIQGKRAEQLNDVDARNDSLPPKRSCCSMRFDEPIDCCDHYDCLHIIVLFKATS